MQIRIQLAELNIKRKAPNFVCLTAPGVLRFQRSSFDYVTELEFDKFRLSQAFVKNSEDAAVQNFFPGSQMHQSTPLPIRNQPSQLQNV